MQLGQKPGESNYNFRDFKHESYALMNACHRCDNPKHHAYGYYGQRGIKVNYKNLDDLLSDIGPRPSKKHSLDRIDNNGHYEKGNCRWATKLQQMRNKSGTHLITYKGETHPITEWAELMGITGPAMRYRLSICPNDLDRVFQAEFKGKKRSYQKEKRSIYV